MLAKKVVATGELVLAKNGYEFYWVDDAVAELEGVLDTRTNGPQALCNVALKVRAAHVIDSASWTKKPFSGQIGFRIGEIQGMGFLCGPGPLLFTSSGVVTGVDPGELRWPPETMS